MRATPRFLWPTCLAEKLRTKAHDHEGTTPPFHASGLLRHAVDRLTMAAWYPLGVTASLQWKMAGLPHLQLEIAATKQLGTSERAIRFPRG